MSSKIEHITSDKNTKVKSLISRKDELFIFEGEKLVLDIIGKNFIPDVFIVNNDYREKFISIPLEEMNVWYVSEKVIRKISSFKSPPAIIAVYEKLPENPGFSDSNIVFAMDNIQDPGNLGSSFRCAAAFGIRSIALTGESVKLTNAKFLRTAQNSVFYLSIERFDTLENFIDEAEKKKYNVYLTSSHKQGRSVSIENIKLPAVIVLGNEGKGVNENLFYKYPSIMIKQTNLVESLNAGISGCILMNLISDHFELINS
ncbi:MAG: RNA methyltransferase [Candidatus Aminicenantes bacterium]|nr:RNA methyltransferase [Candidatus Aminicenantes bacterium]